MQGIVYIAIGKEYLHMSIASALSLKTESPICIISDTKSDIDLPCNLSIINVSNPATNSSNYSAYLKTQLHYLSPFQKTLFLDSDILCQNNLDPIWDFIGSGLTLAPAFDPIKAEVNYQSKEVTYTQSLLKSHENFTQFNSGVLLFEKSDKMSVFFDKWSDELMRFQHHENMALMRLILTEDMLVNALPSRYNEFYPNKGIESCLIHYIGNYKKYL